MKLAIMEDLHLPYRRDALQYQALNYYLKEIEKSGADALVVPGDFTADGNRETADFFLSAMDTLHIPVLVMTGNAEYRDPESLSFIRSLPLRAKNELSGGVIFTLRDGEGAVSKEDALLLREANEKTPVFLHHPIESLSEPSRTRMAAFREAHPEVPIFVGHAHIEKREGNTYYLNAADPDKAIGMEPCIYFYDTEEKTLTKTHFPCPVPKDFASYIGISAFHPLEDLAFAAEKGLYAVELRPSVVKTEREALVRAIERFRACGGRIVSFHFPNIAERDGSLAEAEELLSYAALCSECGANRVTVHAPSVPLSMIEKDPAFLEGIADLCALALNALPEGCEVGVENMHMAKGDTPENRRFGYTPEECEQYIRLLQKRTSRPVGFHFDSGHARNNRPLSQIYTQSVWMAALGQRINGCHIHQVLHENGKFFNHCPITEPYGALISYATFFRMWEEGRIRKAPIFLEIRPTEEDPAPYKLCLSWIFG